MARYTEKDLIPLKGKKVKVVYQMLFRNEKFGNLSCKGELVNYAWKKWGVGWYDKNTYHLQSFSITGILEIQEL